MTSRATNLALSLVAVLAGPAAVTGVVGSNSEQTKPAAQIFADSQKAMLGAKNFHVKGFFNNGGATTSLNLSISQSGGGGSVSEPGVTLEVVVAAHNVYIKADEASWLKLTGSKSTAELVAGRWIEAPATNPDVTPFAQLADSKTFLNQITAGKAQLSKLPVTAVWGGHRAIILTDGQGDRLYVVDGTTPYMLHIQGGGSGTSGYITFTDFGTAPMPAIPVNAVTFPGS